MLGVNIGGLGFSLGFRAEGLGLRDHGVWTHKDPCPLIVRETLTGGQGYIAPRMENHMKKTWPAL